MNDEELEDDLPMQLMKKERIIEYTPDGLTIVEVTVHQSSTFYRGPRPLVYRTGLFKMSHSTQITSWIELKEFRIEYSNRSEREIPGIGVEIPATALATAHDGRVLGRAEVVELVRGSGIFVEEQHFGTAGDYFARSFFTFGGQKESEADARGRKELELFFLWPMG